MATVTGARSLAQTMTAAAAVAVLIAGCGGGDSSGTSDVATDDAAVEESAADDSMDQEADDDSMDEASGEDAGDTDAGAAAELPATAELDGRRLTVHELDETTLAFDEPDAGNEVIYLRVTVENVSAEPWLSSQLQFFLIDGDGNEIGPELLGSEAGDTLPEVDGLAQGESSEGVVSYQVPAGASLTLSYAVDLSAGRTIDIPLR